MLDDYITATEYRMSTVDCTRPPKLFRYSEYRWLERSLLYGEFRLVPASVYSGFSHDEARHDNELVRENTVAGDKVTITHVATGQPIRAIGDVGFSDEVGTNYFTLCFSSVWNVNLFDDFSGADACLVVHDTAEVCERIHHRMERALIGWIGIDGPVSYGGSHRYGPTFMKRWLHMAQREWRFAWVPPQQIFELHPLLIRIGNIEGYAEIVRRPATLGDCVA